MTERMKRVILRAGVLATAFLLGIAPARIAAADTPITYAQSGTGLIYLVTDVARAKGFFKQEGLDPVKVVPFGGGSKAAAAVIAGEAQFGPGFFHVVYSAVEEQLGKDRELVAISTVLSQFALQVVVTPEAYARLNIRPETPVAEKIKALKGLRIGISSPGSSTDLLLRILLPKQGLNPDTDITMVSLGSGGPLLAALEKKAIDGFVWLSPVPETATKRGIGKVLLNLTTGEVKELDGFYYLGDYATRKFIREKPEIVQAWVNGTARAIKFIHENPEAVIELARTLYPDADPEVLPDAVRSMISAVPKTPLVTEQGVRGNYEMIGISLKKKIDLPFDSVVDNRFAEQATQKIIQNK